MDLPEVMVLNTSPKPALLRVSSLPSSVPFSEGSISSLGTLVIPNNGSFTAPRALVMTNCLAVSRVSDKSVRSM
nr:MAG TPA: hypothetical protein [Caudoviricetes sp.]